ncbi:MAG: hypothetical protein ABSF88_07145 [Candidatus Aminicenantales bacterium]|jgi:hypothetical protein
MSETDDGRYFQEIARRFLAGRGAPFFLSAKDLDLVASWARAGIPLQVVLEGIERAFENHRTWASKRDKVLSLGFCRAQVERAFDRFRERNVGGVRANAARPDKRVLIRSEIEKFLERIPPELGPLKDIYLEALKKMAGGPAAADDDLEPLDRETERLLLKIAGPADRSAVETEILAEHKRLSRDALAEAVRVKVLKRLRDAYKIPYLSPYYY